MRMERPGLRWLEEAGKDLREMNAERWRQKEGDSEEWATVGGPLSQASGRAGRQVSWYEPEYMYNSRTSYIIPNPIYQTNFSNN